MAALVGLVGIGGAAVAGCSVSGTEEQAGTNTSPAPPLGDGLPIDALPALHRDTFEDCPYLDDQFVAETNGQRVLSAAVDTRFDPPACQFWSYADEPQLTVVVRQMPSPSEAMAVVDWATPIDLTAPADDPAGWHGGRHGGGEVPGRIGAAYSVAKGRTAVTVFTNQDESVKAQLVAERVIANLGL